MAGLAPVISIQNALHLTNRDHRHKAGDDVRRGIPDGISRSGMVIG
jgi:hypothetical protein